MKESKVCPYNDFCPEYGVETVEHIGYGVGAEFPQCEGGRYDTCPLYAVQVRADDMNVRTNALSGAFLRYLRENPDLEFIIISELGDEVVVKGFDNGTEGSRRRASQRQHHAKPR